MFAHTLLAVASTGYSPTATTACHTVNCCTGKVGLGQFASMTCFICNYGQAQFRPSHTSFRPPLVLLPNPHILPTHPVPSLLPSSPVRAGASSLTLTRRWSTGWTTFGTNWVTSPAGWRGSWNERTASSPGSGSSREVGHGVQTGRNSSRENPGVVGNPAGVGVGNRGGRPAPGREDSTCSCAGAPRWG